MTYIRKTLREIPGGIFGPYCTSPVTGLSTMVVANVVISCFPAGPQAALRSSTRNAALWKYAAEEMLRQNDITLAEQALRMALQLQPKGDELHLLLVDTFDRAGKYSSAVVLLEHLLKNERIAARVGYLRARVLLHSGEFDEARTTYGNAQQHRQHWVRIEPTCVNRGYEV